MDLRRSLRLLQQQHANQRFQNIECGLWIDNCVLYVLIYLNLFPLGFLLIDLVWFGLVWFGLVCALGNLMLVRGFIEPVIIYVVILK